MPRYSIKELEQLSGVKAHTIRIWEQRYGIFTPNRSETNIRRYTNAELRQLLNISLLNNNGFKISQIARMPEEEVCKAVLGISENSAEACVQVESLLAAMIEMDEEKFEKRISANISKQGFEKTFCNVIFPLLRKIGMMWQAEAINPAQEHFISNLIRQKVLAATDALTVNYSSDAQRFILFLPEGEIHELGLLYLNYIIKSRNGRSLYLGQSIPFKDLIKAVNLYEPHFICGVITCPVRGMEVEEYIGKMADEFQNNTILLSGNAIISNKDSLGSYSNVKVLNDMQELLDFIESRFVEVNA